MNGDGGGDVVDINDGVDYDVVDVVGDDILLMMML